MSALPALLDQGRPRFLPLEQSAGEASAHPHLRAAAVVAAFYPAHGEIRFILTERTHTLSSHAGQISLPGGGAEPHDTDLWETAVREAYEEVGIPPAALQPLGRLDSLQMNVTRYLITPFVAWCDERPAFSPDPREVHRIIEVPLDHLLDPETVYTDQWTFREREWRVVAFRFGSDTVWGATARILGDLARRLDPSFPAEPVPGSVVALDAPFGERE